MNLGFFMPAWAPAWTASLVNHLWQSTAVVLVAWLLTLLLRNNSARVRYVIWMIASIKFLVPFALLSKIGALWATAARTSAAAAPAFYGIVEEINQPFHQRLAPVAVASHTALPGNTSQIFFSLPAMLWICGFLVALAIWISRWRHAAATARSAVRVTIGREVHALRLAERNAGQMKETPLLLSRSEIEPGIFGVARPVLLWPVGLSERLDDAQIAAIMAHEIEHVARRDNLSAAIHALVETIFWIHPLVRWMGRKLNEERERACDERVLERSALPEAYADSILKVCAFCLEPPSPWVSGVSGADLKDRVLRIMARHSGTALSSWRKVLLASAALLALALPIAIGVVHGQTAATADDKVSQVPTITTHLPKYDVASIKPYRADDGRVSIMLTPDGVSMQGAPMRMLLQQAFGVEDDRILGEPAWAKTNRYNIEAKVEPEQAPKLKDLKGEQRDAMMLQLLIDRFNLKYHHEQRELPMYGLVVAKGGSKMKASKPEEDSPEPDSPKAGDGPQKRGRRSMMMQPGHLEAAGVPVDTLIHVLSRQLSRTVVDKTGLTGTYDFVLDFTPDNAPPPGAGGPDGGPHKGDAPENAGGPSIFTALQDQLGLKLEAQKGTVDVIVIDHIDTPSDN